MKDATPQDEAAWIEAFTRSALPVLGGDEQTLLEVAARMYVEVGSWVDPVEAASAVANEHRRRARLSP